MKMRPMEAELFHAYRQTDTMKVEVAMLLTLIMTASFHIFTI
jgi:hypothetical protein